MYRKIMYILNHLCFYLSRKSLYASILSMYLQIYWHYIRITVVAFLTSSLRIFKTIPSQTMWKVFSTRDFRYLRNLCNYISILCTEVLSNLFLYLHSFVSFHLIPTTLTRKKLFSNQTFYSRKSSSNPIKVPFKTSFPLPILNQDLWYSLVVF